MAEKAERGSMFFLSTTQPNGLIIDVALGSTLYISKMVVQNKQVGASIFTILKAPLGIFANPIERVILDPDETYEFKFPILDLIGIETHTLILFFLGAANVSVWGWTDNTKKISI